MSQFDELDLDPEEQEWMSQKNKAASRRAASRAAAPELNPKEMTPAEYDAQRKQQIEKDRERIRTNAVTPASLHGEDNTTDLTKISTSVSLPPDATAQDLVKHPGPSLVVSPHASPNIHQGAQNPKKLTFWACEVDGRRIVTYSWNILKDKLKDFEGLFTAEEYCFDPEPTHLLMFFVPDQYPGDPGYVQLKPKSFDIFIKNGKVFRSES